MSKSSRHLQSLKRTRSGLAIIQLPERANLARVDDALSGLTGITDYRANSVNRTIRVEFDPEKVTIEQIREKLGAK